MKRYRIPVRVDTNRAFARTPADRHHPADKRHPADERRPAAEDADTQSLETQSGVPEIVRESASTSSEEKGWQDRALRLQAEMENYRKRQRRIAQEQAVVDQERLLSDVLVIADNLDRTLSAAKEDGSIRRGVELTRDELSRVLLKYGVERIEAQGKPFDPTWHEAVDVISAAASGVQAGTVVEVIQSGYRRGERLFRPARVIVAN